MIEFLLFSLSLGYISLFIIVSSLEKKIKKHDEYILTLQKMIFIFHGNDVMETISEFLEGVNDENK